MLLLNVSGPERNVPPGISTVPPPAALAALIAFWMAVVLVAIPSPTAPKLVMTKVWLGMTGKAGSAQASRGAVNANKKGASGPAFKRQNIREMLQQMESEKECEFVQIALKKVRLSRTED